MNDGLFPEIEDRLRNEAGRLAASAPPVVPVDSLRAGYRHARRRQVAVRVLAVLVPVLALAAAWVAVGGRIAEPPTAERAAPEPRAMVESPQPDAPEVAVPEPARVEAVPAPSQDIAGGIVGVPVLIIRSDGETESILPGVLVPARETPVPVLDLSPVERRAVQRVLNLDDEGEVYEAI